MEEKSGPPGVMIYHDILPALDRLTDEQCGKLLRAIVGYSAFGEAVELDTLSGMVFDLVRPKIDRDMTRYAETVDQRRYAVYCRDAKKTGKEPLEFTEWKKRSPL